MGLNEARKTLGYDELPKLGLGRRPKSRTLGYHQLPNGEVNPVGFGAPLALAPRPATVSYPKAPPPPPSVPRPSLRLVTPLESLPVASLKRAQDIPEETRSVEPASPVAEAAAWPLVRRRSAVTENFFASAPAFEEEEELFVVPEQEAPSSTRRIAVRVLASLSIIAAIAGGVYVGMNNQAARTAVTGWATMGHAK